MSTPERAGWYDDPEDESLLRYFDGIIWSDRTVPKRTRVAAPSPSPGVDPATGESQAPTSGSVTGSSGPGTDVFGRPTAGGGPYGGAPQHGAPQHGAPQGPAVPKPPEPTTADGEPLASYGPRAVAYVLDLIVLGLLNAIFAGWAGWLWMKDYLSLTWDAALANEPERVEGITPEQLFGMLDWKYFFIALGIGLVVRALYDVGFLSRFAATPGKMAVGLSVRRADRPGRPSPGTAFMRSVLPLGVMLVSAVPLVSYLASFVTLADLLWPIKDQQRQALHDKIAGTQVVRGRQPRS